MKIISKLNTNILLFLFIMIYGQLNFGQMKKLPFDMSGYYNTTLVTASNNDLLSFWFSNNRLYKASSNDSGVTWGDSLILDGFSYPNGSGLKSILLSSGNVLVLFLYNGQHRLKISTDNGHTWAGVSNPVTGQDYNIYNMTIAQSLTGKVFLTYNKNNALYYKISNNDGHLFGSE